MSWTRLASSTKLKKVVGLVATSMILGSTALASLSDGSGLSTTGGAAHVSGFNGDIPTIVGRFIGSLLGLLGVVFVCLIIYGGFIWMTAQGSEDKIKKAKGVISSAVIGLVIVFASYVIAQAVVAALSSSLDSGAAPPPS